MGEHLQLDFCLEQTAGADRPLQGKGFQELPGDPKDKDFPSRYHTQTTQGAHAQAQVCEQVCVGIHSRCTSLATARLGTVP